MLIILCRMFVILRARFEAIKIRRFRMVRDYMI